MVATPLERSKLDARQKTDGALWRRPTRPALSKRAAGFTLVETAVVLLITGLITSAVVQGQELIRNARVRDVISQQQAAEGAFLCISLRNRSQHLAEIGPCAICITRFVVQLFGKPMHLDRDVEFVP